MRVPDSRRIAVICLVLMLAVFGVFAALPSLDTQAAALFYRGDAFPAERIKALETFRMVLWDAAIAGFLLSFAGLLFGRLKRYRLLGLSTRLWGFFTLLYVAAPALLVNVVLKSHWGRARPYQTDLFGGDALFTPFWTISDQCARNCSFVSGEVSGATALSILLIVGVWHLRLRLAKVVVWAIWGVATLLPLLSTVQRMAAGRHFLSDCLMAILLTTFLAAILYRAVVERAADRGRAV